MNYGEFRTSLIDSGNKEMIAIAENGTECFRMYVLWSAIHAEAEKKTSKDGKGILHFQIPEHLLHQPSLYTIEHMKDFIAGIKEKYSDGYNIIISPLVLQADGMVNITISADTDIKEVIDKLDMLSGRVGNDS